ncbi:hypothetical protein BP354E_5819 [Burkholderia pseudomallei 354e]|uniref:hypothetical protein n=1 Tax=Burkholderia pseudomallei TaxID=28450 RepID=UPI00025C222F|nr:hypothetical protein [Burkholderia pseudomallei]EIF68902.1 hypothetical protein BP354E_5819 [Burkholderia pseudomallei 354e]EIF72594.1 hypothetical protein BP354A_6012 [Burkholderia pseudomallei 354a]CAJ3034294.1 Uncharacterised protein [Burkholderia pseudomallei]CAJ3104697.1 Uncharacterised protein [Burkholderia pseudomallei]CAJ3568181.1 Uncharacterised protein [Burkholderia pseudomallei]
MGLLGGKLSSLGSGLKDSLAEAKNKVVEAAERVEMPAALSDLTNMVTSGASDLYVSGKGHATRLTDMASEKLSQIDYDALKRPDTYVAKFQEYREFSVEKVTNYYRATFEVDKTTSEMISDLRGRLPARAKDVDDIFERIKREALQRAISAFCLAPIMRGLDNKLEGRYDNLSMTYNEYKKRPLDNHENYATLENTRSDSLPLTPVSNGYNRNEVLYPADAEIDHIISKKEYFEDWLVRLSTNDQEFVDVINGEDNLTFVNGSFNSGKSSRDLMQYIEDYGQPDELDPNIIHFQYEKGGHVTINKAEAQEKYEQAHERMRQARIDAAKEIGLTVASASARMAAQQVVGLIVVETIDIFVDEIKDIAVNGKLFDENGLLANINQRRQNISDKLAQRFEERQVWARARAAGIEGGVAGALAAIPQILISLIVKMPAFMLAIIRECTLSVVRSARVLISDDENKFDSIKVVMLGTASAVMGVYVANVISKAVAAVPMLNVFNRQVTEVLSGVVVTAAPLSAVYVFDKYKSKLVFAALGGSEAA